MTCKKLISEDVKETIEKIATLEPDDKSNPVFDPAKIGEYTQVSGGHSGSGLYIIPYPKSKSGKAIAKVTKLDANTHKVFDSSWILNTTQINAVRELVVGCTLHNQVKGSLRKSIPKVYTYGMTKENQLYMVLEFIEGIDLAEALEKHVFKSAEELIEFIKKLFQILIKLFDENKFIHQDLKLANVMVTNLRGRVKKPILIDFGRSMFPNLILQDNLKNFLLGLQHKNYYFARYRNKDDRGFLDLIFDKDRTHILNYDLKFILIPVCRYLKANFKVKGLYLSKKQVKRSNAIGNYGAVMRYIMSVHPMFKELRYFNDKSKKRTKKSQKKSDQKENARRTKRSKK